MMRKLEQKFVEKVWGVERLPAPFPHPSEERIGEIWFEPPAELDELLVKYIFASERLSVQSHPDDDQAEALGLGRKGKSECWIILDAEPGATIAVGFHQEHTAEEVRAAALDGSIVDMLVWHEVVPGDAFYIPAGTVHAIGGGVGLIEVQQNSDVTFRLFDYGRPRELHLDDGLAVSRFTPYPDSLRKRMDGPGGVLVDGPLFRLHYVQPDHGLPELADAPALIIPFSGEVSCRSEALRTGDCVLVEHLAAGDLAGNGIALVAQPLRQGRQTAPNARQVANVAASTNS